MTTIKDIFQWYEIEPTKCPVLPRGLTPIQAIEWEEQNLNSIKEFKNYLSNKSFIGELLVDAPAIIENITKSNIFAYTKYYARDGMQYLESSPTLAQPTYSVGYEITYDESLYEKVKLIYQDSMVYLEGKILKFEKKRIQGHLSEYPACKIQLKLTNIKVIDKHFLCDTLVSSRKKNEDDKNRSSSIGTGILGGIIGLIVGRILGGIISFIISIFVNQTDSIAYIIMVICGIFGFYIGFIAKRTK